MYHYGEDYSNYVNDALRANPVMDKEAADSQGGGSNVLGVRLISRWKGKNGEPKAEWLEIRLANVTNWEKCTHSHDGDRLIRGGDSLSFIVDDLLKAV